MSSGKNSEACYRMKKWKPVRPSHPSFNAPVFTDKLLYFLEVQRSTDCEIPKDYRAFTLRNFGRVINNMGEQSGAYDYHS